eukprot:2205527-Amphidinium_carterae.1
MPFLSFPTAEVVCSSTQTLAPALCGAIRAGAFGHNLPGDNIDVDSSVEQDHVADYIQSAAVLGFLKLLTNLYK